MIQDALNCLRDASSSLTDSYSLALFAYTLTLANDPSASDLFTALKNKAITEGRFMFLFPEILDVRITVS